MDERRNKLKNQRKKNRSININYLFILASQVKLTLVGFLPNDERLHIKFPEIHTVKWIRNHLKEICKVPSTAGRFAKNATKAGGVAFRISSNALVPAPASVEVWCSSI